jgi:hypothetical protein
VIIEFDCEECGQTRRVHRGRGQPAPRYCSTDCRWTAHRKNPFPVERAWLYDKYVTEGLGCPEIARIVNKDPSTVQHWLECYGIPTRPRGSDRRQWFKAGQRTRLGSSHSSATRAKIGAASRARGAVPYRRNGKHWLAGTSGADNPNWRGGVTPERQTLYRSSEWRKVARFVWRRDRTTCQRCGLNAKTVDRSKVIFHIHHIVSFAVVELRCEPSNLVLLCDDCHHWVHSNENRNRDFIKSPVADSVGLA